MKKFLLLFSLLIFINIPATFAATGAAYDGALFLLSIGGILLLIAALFWSIDFLRKNGRRILSSASHLFLKLFSPRTRKDAKPDDREEYHSAPEVSW
ncbi:MAG: hypothetical protein WCO93_11610 [bacterium]